MKQKMARLALLALVVGSMITWMSLPASALPVRHSSYDHFVKLRFKEKWLLPPVALQNPYSSWELGLHRVLRPFTTLSYVDFRQGKRVSGNPAKAIMAVDLNLQPAPFGTDVLLKRDQANALVQLGMLSHMGHFAVLNANNEYVRADAVDILRELGDVADHFKMGNLRAQYERLATEVGDPKYNGGPGPVVTRYDDTVRALYDYVANSYGVDGHWYFMYGGDIAGILALSAGGDRLHTQYFLSVLSDLYHSRPVLRPDYMTRDTMSYLEDASARDSAWLANQSWNIVQHYLLDVNGWTAFRTHEAPFGVPEDANQDVDPVTGSRYRDWYYSRDL